MRSFNKEDMNVAIQPQTGCIYKCDDKSDDTCCAYLEGRPCSSMERTKDIIVEAHKEDLYD